MQWKQLDPRPDVHKYHYSVPAGGRPLENPVFVNSVLVGRASSENPHTHFIETQKRKYNAD